MKNTCPCQRYHHFWPFGMLANACHLFPCTHQGCRSSHVSNKHTRATAALALFNSNSCWPVSPKPTLIQVSGDTWIWGPVFTTWSLKAFGPSLTHASGRQRTLTWAEHKKKEQSSFANSHFGPAGGCWKLCVSVHKVLLTCTGVRQHQTNRAGRLS